MLDTLPMFLFVASLAVFRAQPPAEMPPAPVHTCPCGIQAGTATRRRKERK